MPVAVVIRPGETDFDQQGRVQGTLDLPLNAQGQRQVSEIVAVLRDRAIKQILTAPHDPARSTARLIGQALGIGVKELDDLVNFDYGLWQGRCVEEIRRKNPKVFKQWSESPESVCPPGGETCEEAFGRARKALRKAMKRKDHFAVVCSEPMATLVECVLRHTEPALPPPCSRDRSSLVEFIELTKPETVAVSD
ncbi:MAG: histidine phosphatase family protein [Planctomycetaceae bacterium]